MDIRRFQLLGLIVSRLRYILYLIRIGRFRMALTHIWVGLFTRDSGLALLDILHRLFPFIRPYPQAMEIEITTRCHLRCAICEHTYWEEPPRDMSYEEFKKVIDQFPKLKWIGTSGIGSSFLNKDFLKMLRLLKSRSVFVEFFDSFDLVDRAIAEELVDLKIDKIWVSMDACTEQTYAKIRVGTNLDKVLGNIRTLLDIKEQRCSPLPEVWYQMIVTKLNVNEMPDYVDLIHSLVKGRKYNFATLIFWSNILSFPEVRHLSTDIPQDIRKEVLSRARKYGIYITWNENIQPIHPVSYCVRWNEPFVLVTGNVQPCCIINQANQREHQKRYSFGNLFYEDFRDIWRSKKFKDFLNTIKRNEFPDICRFCRIYIPGSKCGNCKQD